MKWTINKMTFTSFVLMFVLQVYAQVPQAIVHQLVIRDSVNQLVTESLVGIRVSILQGTPDGPSVYTETHTPYSNSNGLVSFVLGQGSNQVGNFSAINWADIPFFIKTETDISGGSNYTLTGVSKMHSVPYVLLSSSLTLTSENGMKYEVIVDDFGNISSNILPGQPCPGISQVFDIEGNKYTTVLIGSICWMRENLRTTQYRNGGLIKHLTAANEWSADQSGAYVWYNNDLNWKNIYGALYNWYAVNNSNGLCPAGWHVPTDAEFSQLINYLIDRGFPNQPAITNGAGNALKSCRQVSSPLGGICNTNEHPRWDSNSNFYGFDEFVFSGLPGGYRNANGSFGLLGNYGYMWTSSENSASTAWSRYLYSTHSNIPRDYYGKAFGLSVRCVKDASMK